MNDNKKPILMTRMALIIRSIVGIYILYLAYSLTVSEDEKSMLIKIFTVLFYIVGVFLIGVSAKKLLKGEYQGGKADDTPADDDSEDEDPNMADYNKRVEEKSLRDKANAVNTMDEADGEKEPIVEVISDADAEVIEGETMAEKAVDFRGVNSVETVSAKDYKEL